MSQPDHSPAVPELHLNADRDITPEKREILIKMFGLLAVQAMEEAPAVRAERRRKENEP